MPLAALDPSLSQHSWLPNHGFWFADPKAEIVDDFFATYGVRFGTDICRLYRAVLEQSSDIDQALNDRPGPSSMVICAPTIRYSNTC